MTGLIEKCDGYNGDPAGPFSLSRGGLVRGMRPDGLYTHLQYSRDGERWEGYRVFTDQLRTGDVSAIRAELLADRPVPEPAAGSTRFVWCYRSAGGFDYAEGKRPATYRSTFWHPTRWHSCYAFNAAGEFLGYFSPHYPDRGWRQPEGYEGSWSIDTVMDSLGDAQAALRDR